MSLLTGTNVLVVGGTGGTNLAVARSFARDGANVGVLSRSSKKVQSAIATLQHDCGGGQVAGWTADVRDHNSVLEAIEGFGARFGALDCLITGPAANFLAALTEMTPTAFRTSIDIGLIGTFHVMHAAHPLLRKPGASVVNMSAVQSFMPMRYQSHACAAKAGIDMLTRVLALEWASDGIRVNSVAPGPIAETAGARRIVSTAEAELALRSHVPAGRLVRQEEVAELVRFLCSSAALMITGQIFPLDGGLTVGHYGPEMDAAVPRGTSYVRSLQH